MINKYDKHLNSSLSFISKFDLKEDDKNDIYFIPHLMKILLNKLIFSTKIKKNQYL